MVKQLRSEIELFHNQLTIKDNQKEQITKALTNQQSLQLEHYRNNESDTQDVSRTSDIDSDDISYKGTDEVRTHDEKVMHNVHTPKKKSLLSRLFNK